MDTLGPGRVQLRPPRGGREWDADAAYVRPAKAHEILRMGPRAANRSERRTS